MFFKTYTYCHPLPLKNILLTKRTTILSIQLLIGSLWFSKSQVQFDWSLGTDKFRFFVHTQTKILWTTPLSPSKQAPIGHLTLYTKTHVIEQVGCGQDINHLIRDTSPKKRPLHLTEETLHGLHGIDHRTHNPKRLTLHGQHRLLGYFTHKHIHAYIGALF